MGASRRLVHGCKQEVGSWVQAGGWFMGAGRGLVHGCKQKVGAWVQAGGWFMGASRRLVHGCKQEVGAWVQAGGWFMGASRRLVHGCKQEVGSWVQPGGWFMGATGLLEAEMKAAQRMVYHTREGRTLIRRGFCKMSLVNLWGVVSRIGLGQRQGKALKGLGWNGGAWGEAWLCWDLVVAGNAWGRDTRNGNGWEGGSTR